MMPPISHLLAVLNHPDVYMSDQNTLESLVDSYYKSRAALTNNVHQTPNYIRVHLRIKKLICAHLMVILSFAVKVSFWMNAYELYYYIYRNFINNFLNRQSLEFKFSFSSSYQSSFVNCISS